MSSLKDEKIEKILPIVLSSLSLLVSIVALVVMLKNAKNYADIKFHHPEIIVQKGSVTESSDFESGASSSLDKNSDLQMQQAKSDDSISKVIVDNQIETSKNTGSLKSTDTGSKVVRITEKADNKLEEKMDSVALDKANNHNAKNKPHKATPSKVNKTNDKEKLVQVGSFKTEAIAKKHCVMLVDKNRAFFKQHKNIHCVPKKYSVNQQTIYRSIIVGIKNNEESKSLCSALKKSKINCILKHD